MQFFLFKHLCPHSSNNLHPGKPRQANTLAIAIKSSALTALTILLLTVAVVTGNLAHAQQESKRELVLVRGDLYRFINNHHAGIVYVTRDGIIVGDPINSEAAEWLKNELAQRFGVPVKYVFYSHHHADHASGGEVFADSGAVIVAHKNSAELIRSKNIPTALPQVLFDKQLTLDLGGKQVNLHYLGANHSEDMIIAEFPQEDAVFAVDFVSVERLPYQTLQGGKFPDWYLSIDALTRLPFTYLVPGHGKVGIKNDAVEHARYLRELENRVARAKAAGLTLEEMQNTLKFPRYSDWQNYEEWLPQNIEGVLRIHEERSAAAE